MNQKPKRSALDSAADIVLAVGIFAGLFIFYTDGQQITSYGGPSYNDIKSDVYWPSALIAFGVAFAGIAGSYVLKKVDARRK